MASEKALIAALHANTKAVREYAESNQTLATAVHALADALAACTSESVGSPETEPAGAVPMYADGTPIGG